MAYWLAIGPSENWELGLKHGVWGIGGRYLPSWDRVVNGDTVIFYVMRPVKGIIGYGTMKGKSKETKPFWPQEMKDKKMLWPLHLHVNKGLTLPRNKWESHCLPMPPLSEGIVIQRAFQPLKDKLGKQLVEQLGAK